MLTKKYAQQQRRFRGSIYVDVIVEGSADLETDRSKAQEQLEQISQSIPNSYVGGVGYFGDNSTLDREI